MNKDNKLTPLLKEQGENTVSADFLKEMEVDVLARTLWGEARSEGSAGMEAVASAILNRVDVAKTKGGFWWGNNVLQVCQKPYQFSCWNKSDPNFKKLTAVTDEDAYFATAKRIARRALLGFIPDTTYGATHYHTFNIQPHWAKGQKPTTRIGRHIFYSINEG